MESIYNLVPEEEVIVKKPPMYRSAHNKVPMLAGSTIGLHGTSRLPGTGTNAKIHAGKSASLFGPKDRSSRNNPQTFLKSGERCMKVTGRNTTEIAPYTRNATVRKPGVPPAAERPVMSVKTNKNFITANAVEAILQAPQRVNQSEGDYLNKADFGKVPEYLSQVKEEIRRENEMIDAYVAEMNGSPYGGGGGGGGDEAVSELTDEDRRALLGSLKAKWDSVNSKYQKMCHMVKLDTVGKVKRKETMEKELDQIEADIKKLAARGPIYVTN